jgi:hypothetical protein
MTQPANKRFVMEDALTTELASYAPLADPTFTGTVTSGIVDATEFSGVNFTATGDVTASTGNVTASKLRATSTSGSTSSDAALITGDPGGDHIGISAVGISAMSDETTNSTLSINTGGGNVSIGDATTTVTINGELTARGYRFVSRFVHTTTPAAFTKATYPWLRAIRVICVGAGGGGGGAALTGASQNAIAQAGAGGAYAETFITNIAGLASSETLTVGAAGTAGAAGGAGGLGGDTSFGTLCVAKGGTAGGSAAASALSLFGNGAAGVAASSSTGDIVVPGGSSETRDNAYAASVSRPRPGGSFLFPHPQVQASITTTTSAGFSPGTGVYGVGGFGGINAQNQAAAVAGGIGSGGIMIVELYA